MTANMSTSLYGRISEATGIPQHAIKKVLYFLAYNGEMGSTPPAAEEFKLRPGVQFAQRTIAVQELAEWLVRWSASVNRENPGARGNVAVQIALEILDGADTSARLRDDYANVCEQLAELRHGLSELQELADTMAKIGGA